MLCDGGGLYLQATEFGSKTWIFRYLSPITGKLRDMGLGSILSVGLAGQALAVIDAAAAGELAPSQAAQIVMALGGVAKIIEATDLLKRIEALESLNTVP